MSKPSVIFISALLLFSANLSAQIATDGSLGPPAQDLQGPNYKIGADLGKQRDANLFHSFQDFNLNSAESATFSGPTHIQNVISRVTGGNPSEINGLIYSEMLADFYFLNPYGIVFGPNARLDVQGSFHASTANSLHFSDGTIFSAVDNKPLLTVASPEAFGFLDTSPVGNLSLNGSFLELRENQTLSLFGGPLTITNSTLFAPHGNINLVGLGELQIKDSTVYAPAGRISLLATALQDRIPTSFEALASSALKEEGAINILNTPNRFYNIVFKRAQLSPAFEKLLSLLYEADIDAYEEQAPALIESLSRFDYELFLRVSQDNEIANIDTNGEGGGQVVIRAGQFFLDGGTIFADNEYGSVDGGGIDIEVQGDMHLTNSARITAGAMEELDEFDLEGNVVRGGNISIQAGKLEMSGLNIDQIMQFTPELFQQQFGITEQEASDFLSNLQAIVSELSEQGTEISLDRIVSKMDEQYAIHMDLLEELFIENLFNTIGTRNFGRGNGGHIQINTPILSADHALIETATMGSGTSGDININAQQIKLNMYGLIDASTIFNFDPELPSFINTGTKQAGNITINASESIFLSNLSSITVSAGEGTTGNAGTISLTTPSLRLNAAAQINSFNAGQSSGGTININVNTALLTNDSGIFTEADNAGGGNITFNVLDSLLVDNSRISAEAFGDEPQDNGGNITIENPKFFILNNESKLLTKGFVGAGGNIRIKADYFLESGNPEINASSIFNQDGEIFIDAPEIDLTGALFHLTRDFSQTKFSLDRCAGLTRDTISQFIITIRDVLPPGPGDLKTHHLFFDE